VRALAARGKLVDPKMEAVKQGHASHGVAKDTGLFCALGPATATAMMAVVDLSEEQAISRAMGPAATTC
jgi:hypothetical protein